MKTNRLVRCLLFLTVILPYLLCDSPSGPSDASVAGPVEIGGAAPGPAASASALAIPAADPFCSAPTSIIPISQWQRACVDCPKDVARFSNRSLRLDQDGHPHMAYGGDVLYYTWYDGVTWHDEIVDPSPQVGAYASLALDAAGDAHISYFDTLNDRIKYARRHGATWQIESLPAIADVSPHEYTAIAVDSAGRPHIAFYAERLDFPWSHDLRHAWHDGTMWRDEIVAVANTYSYFYDTPVAIEIDGADGLHVSFYNYGEYSLKYAHYDGTGWEITTIDVGGEFSALSLDPSGRPHIGFFDGSFVGTHDLKYAWFDGATWHVEIVDSEGSVGWGASLALDARGRPHISYYDATNQALKYAWHDGSAWQFQVVQGGMGEPHGKDTSIALTAAGDPHVMVGPTYAWRDGAGWNVALVPGDWGSVGGPVALAIGGKGRLHLAYHDESGNSLKYARRDGLAWSFERVGVLYDSPAGSISLAVDSSDEPHIVYYGGYPGSVKYGRRGADGWELETVPGLDYPDGRVVSLALDGSDRPHILFQYALPFDFATELVYAWHDGVTWHRETVAGTDYPLSSALALDAEGRPHVAYAGSTGVSYARREAGGWLNEMVEETGYPRYVTLALDAAGYPHIAYIGSYLGITHAWNPGSGWQFELIGVDKGGARVQSVVAGDAPRVRVAYSRCGDMAYGWGCELHYAWRNGAGWHTEPVLESAGEGVISVPSASLAVDGQGRPYIGFYDSIRADIQLAWRSATLGKVVHPKYGVRAGDTLSYTLTFAGNGETVRLWDPLPNGLRYVTGSLTSTVTPTARFSPTLRGVMWEGTLLTDTVQRVQFEAVIEAAGVGGQPVPLLNSVWLTDVVAGGFLSATARVDLLPPVALQKWAFPDREVAYGDPITYTLVLSGAGREVQLWDPLPAQVAYLDGSITLPATYSPTAHAVLWRGRLPTDTVQVVHLRVTPLLTGTGSLSLPLPIVNTAWLTDTGTAWRVFSSAIVNGWRRYIPLVVRDY